MVLQRTIPCDTSSSPDDKVLRCTATRASPSQNSFKICLSHLKKACTSNNPKTSPKIKRSKAESATSHRAFQKRHLGTCGAGGNHLYSKVKPAVCTHWILEITLMSCRTVKAGRPLFGMLRFRQRFLSHQWSKHVLWPWLLSASQSFSVHYSDMLHRHAL